MVVPVVVFVVVPMGIRVSGSSRMVHEQREVVD